MKIILRENGYNIKVLLIHSIEFSNNVCCLSRFHSFIKYIYFIPPESTKISNNLYFAKSVFFASH